MTASLSQTSPQAGKLTVVLAASYLTALSQIFTNMQPVILGALADDFGFSNGSLGNLSAVYVACATLVLASAPLWVRRVSWRLLTAAALVMAAVVIVCGAAVTSLSTFMLLFGLFGMFKSMLGVPAFACLGDTENPDRSFGIAAVVQAISATILVAPVATYLIPAFGSPGVFILLGLLLLSGLLVVWFIPADGQAESASRSADAMSVQEPEGAPFLSRAAIPAYVMLFASALFTAGLVGFWYFVERIGVAKGISPSTIGLTLSAGSLGSIVAASLFAWLSQRVKGVVFLLVGSSLLLSCFVMLQFSGVMPFVLANILFSLGWGLSQPPYWSILSQVDATKRLFVAAPMTGGVAAALIGVFSGPIIDAYGFNGMIAFSAISVVVAMSLSIGVYWMTRPEHPELAPPSTIA